jgi:hypothetical protein
VFERSLAYCLRTIFFYVIICTRLLFSWTALSFFLFLLCSVLHESLVSPFTCWWLDLRTLRLGLFWINSSVLSHGWLRHSSTVGLSLNQFSCIIHYY